MKRYIIDNNLIGAGKRFVIVVSGANMNFGRLRFVAERAELGEGREVLFSVEIPEEPGRSVMSLHSLPKILTNESKVSWNFIPSFTPGRSLNFLIVGASRAPRISLCPSYYLQTPPAPLKSPRS